MGFSPGQMYPGATTPDANFIDGKYKNSSAPGVYDGTPLETALFNQQLSSWDALMNATGQTYDNTEDNPTASQLFDVYQLSRPTENKLKGNQVPIVESDSDPLVNSTPTLYVVGSFPAAGVEVITNNAQQLKYENGVWSCGNNTGILRRRYPAGATGLITKSNQYAAAVLLDGTQVKAEVDDIATSGVRITEDSGDICVDIDFSHANISGASGFKFHALSDEPGRYTDISDDESANALYPDLINNREWKSKTSERDFGVLYTNTKDVPIRIYAAVTVGTASAISLGWAVNALTMPGPNVVPTPGNIITMPALEISPGALYSLSKFGGDPSDTLIWYELEN